MHHLYGVIDRLRADHPGLRIETCSGGGGRVDLRILSRTDRTWPSDNTDAADRVTIQHGFGQIYPARVMAAWVTDVPNQLTGRSVPMRYRFHAAMAGVLAVGGDLARWTPEEFTQGAELVAQYKKVRHIGQHGIQHRLRGPVDDGPTAVQYTTPDRREVFMLVWQRVPRYGMPRPARRLAGLDPAACYRNAATGAVHHASVLTGYGITAELPAGDWSSASPHLIRVDDEAVDDGGPSGS